MIQKQVASYKFLSVILQLVNFHGILPRLDASYKKLTAILEAKRKAENAVKSSKEEAVI